MSVVSLLRHRWSIGTFVLLLATVCVFGIYYGSSSAIISDLFVFHGGMRLLPLTLLLGAGLLSVDFVELFRERYLFSVRTRARLGPYIGTRIIKRAAIGFAITVAVVIVWYLLSIVLPRLLGWDTNHGSYYPHSGLTASQLDVQSSYLGPLVEVSPVLYAVVIAALSGAVMFIGVIGCCLCALLFPWPLIGLLVPFVVMQLDNVILGLAGVGQFRSINLINPWSMQNIQGWEVLPAAGVYMVAPIILWWVLRARRFEVGNLL